MDIGKYGTSCLRHTNGSLVSDVCGHGCCGDQTRSLTNQCAYNICTCNFADFILDCYTAVFYEERCAVIDLVAVKTLQNSREKVADVCCYCCGGKSVCNVDLHGRVLLAFLFDRLNCFRRELTSKIRTGQIRILAVALCLYDEKALILYKLFVYVIEDCILCCRVCCTELQLRECLISCACFADTKTARCEHLLLCIRLSVYRILYKVLLADVDLCDILQASVFDYGRLKLYTLLRDLQADALRCCCLRSCCLCRCCYRSRCLFV